MLVSDTHPEQTHTLRVDQPFPELEKLARGLDFESMDSMEHSHVPWVVILARAVSVWKDDVSTLQNFADDSTAAICLIQTATRSEPLSRN